MDASVGHQAGSCYHYRSVLSSVFCCRLELLFFEKFDACSCFKCYSENMFPPFRFYWQRSELLTVTLGHSQWSEQTRRSQHSQERKTHCGTVFCASWPWPLTFWPQNRWVSRTPVGIFMWSLVILAAPVLRYPGDKQTDRHTDKRQWKPCPPRQPPVSVMIMWILWQYYLLTFLLTYLLTCLPTYLLICLFNMNIVQEYTKKIKRKKLQ